MAAVPRPPAANFPGAANEARRPTQDASQKGGPTVSTDSMTDRAAEREGADLRLEFLRRARASLREAIAEGADELTPLLDLVEDVLIEALAARRREAER